MKLSPLSDVCFRHERHRSLVMDAVRRPFVTARHYLEQRQQNKLQDARRWQMHHPSAPLASARENTKTLLPVFQWRWLLTDRPHQWLFNRSAVTRWNICCSFSHLHQLKSIWVCLIPGLLLHGSVCGMLQKQFLFMQWSRQQTGLSLTLCMRNEGACVAQKTRLNMEPTFV